MVPTDSATSAASSSNCFFKSASWPVAAATSAESFRNSACKSTFGFESADPLFPLETASANLLVNTCFESYWLVVVDFLEEESLPSFSMASNKSSEIFDIFSSLFEPCDLRDPSALKYLLSSNATVACSNDSDNSSIPTSGSKFKGTCAPNFKELWPRAG